MNQDITLLNNQFAIGEQLSFRDAGNGFIVVDLNNSQCSASIALSGAHLLSWTPTGEQPVIWMSEDAQFINGKSIRGGIPVCWPWFSAHDSESDFPAHGFARTSIWHVKSTASTEDNTLIVLQLQTEANAKIWPYQCSCEIRFDIGRELKIELTTMNNDHQPFTVGEALHSYFAIADIRNTSVSGLEKCSYLNKPTGFSRHDQVGPITFSDEVDRVYLNTTADNLIEDREMRRTIRINKSGSDSTIVWNPWLERAAEMGDLGENGYLGMLCVESANAAENVVTIDPGARHSLSVRYKIEAIKEKQGG